MSQNALSAQGTLVYRAPAATPSTFAVIGEIRDITPPALTRNPIETTAHNDTEEYFVVGIARKGEMQFTIGFVPDLGSHDHLTGLHKAYLDGSRDIWKIVFPEGTEWLFSGYVTNVGVAAPLDDGLTADVTVRPTGVMTIQ